MEIAFLNLTLRTICEDESYARNKLGSKISNILKHRLADLRAATTINDLIVGKPRVLDGTNKHKIIIDLVDNHYIVLCANHVKNPLNQSAEVDWTKVTRIKVLKIGDEYGK